MSIRGWKPLLRFYSGLRTNDSKSHFSGSPIKTFEDDKSRDWLTRVRDDNVKEIASQETVLSTSISLQHRPVEVLAIVDVT
jgi:hypothetical protein